MTPVDDVAATIHPHPGLNMVVQYAFEDVPR